MRKVPITVITGFLGSGKTTLIRGLMRQAHGRKIALIVNEFGELDVDGEILKSSGCGCDEEDIVSLPNGCVCCTVQEEFLPTMLSLLEKDADWDHMLIETSGLALPEPLLRAIHWPDLSGKVTIDAVVSVVDSIGQTTGMLCDRTKVQQQRAADDSLDHDTSIEQLFLNQLSCADVIVLSKADMLEEKDMLEVEKGLRPQVREGVHFVRAEKGKVPIEVLLGLGKESETSFAPDENETPAHHDHEHDDEVSTHVLSVTLPHTVKGLVFALKQLVSSHSIYRIKGFVHVPEKPMRLVLQGVGQRFDHYFDRLWKEKEEKATRLVIIGKNLSEEALKQALDHLLLQGMVSS